MKMKMQLSKSCIAVAVALVCAEASALSFFGSSSPESLMKSADKLIEKADAALAAGNRVQASNGFVRAASKYREIIEKNPDFEEGIAVIRAEYCATQLEQCGLPDLGIVDEEQADAAEPKAAGFAKETDVVKTAADAFKEATGEDDDSEPINDDEEEIAQETYDPRNFVYDFNEARALLESGKAIEAIGIMVPMVKYDPGNRQLRMLMAAARIRAGQNDLAIATLEDLRGRREDLPLLLLISAAYVSAGRHAEALLSLDAAVKLAPAEPDAYMNLAQLTLVMDGNVPEAVKVAGDYYRQALKRGARRNPSLEAVVMPR